MMATKKETLEQALRGEGCLGRAADDEPVFVLRARDVTSSFAVTHWAMLQRLLGSNAHEKIGWANRCAYEMEYWRARTGTGRIAD